MTAKLYPQALKLVLAHEGGFVDHPSDPGGATNRGITWRVYDAYRAKHRLCRQSVKLISDTEVSEIYKSQYWNLSHCDELPAGLDYAVFDTAVNSGIARAVKLLQQTVGVDDDGIVGLVTLAAVRAAAIKSEQRLIGEYSIARQHFVEGLSTFKVFGKGWTRRIVDVETIAREMAARDLEYAEPDAIGANRGEVNGKAR